MDEEIIITLDIPTTLQKDNREFQMICVTKGGKPIVYKDLDKDNKTITFKTNKFYAFALMYKDQKSITR